MSIIPLATLKNHLRVDHTAEDTLIQMYLDAAEQAVARRVQRTLIDPDDTPAEGSDELPMAWDIQAAALMFAAHLYENREAGVVGTITAVLPLSFEYLLATHRLWGPEPHLAVTP